MAKVVGSLPKASGTASTYPWDQWLDGQVWMLIPGVDFKGAANVFRGSVRSAAIRRDLRVSTRLVDGMLYIQATRPL